MKRGPYKTRNLRRLMIEPSALELTPEARKYVVERALNHPDVVALQEAIKSKIATLEGALLIQNKIIFLQRRLLGLSFK